MWLTAIVSCKAHVWQSLCELWNSWVSGLWQKWRWTSTDETRWGPSFSEATCSHSSDFWSDFWCVAIRALCLLLLMDEEMNTQKSKKIGGKLFCITWLTHVLEDGVIWVCDISKRGSNKELWSVHAMTCQPMHLIKEKWLETGTAWQETFGWSESWIREQHHTMHKIKCNDLQDVEIFFSQWSKEDLKQKEAKMRSSTKDWNVLKWVLQKVTIETSVCFTSLVEKCKWVQSKVSHLRNVSHTSQCLHWWWWKRGEEMEAHRMRRHFSRNMI